MQFAVKIAVPAQCGFGVIDLPDDSKLFVVLQAGTPSVPGMQVLKPPTAGDCVIVLVFPIVEMFPEEARSVLAAALSQYASRTADARHKLTVALAAAFGADEFEDHVSN